MRPWPFVSWLAAQLGLLVAAAAGIGLARYYVLVSWATLGVGATVGCAGGN